MYESTFVVSENSHSVTLSPVGPPTSNGFNVGYSTFSPNMPSQYGNTIYVWQTALNTVPWEREPDGVIAVNSDRARSALNLNFSFEDEGYIIGYAVAPTPNAIVATMHIPRGTQQDIMSYEYSSLSIGNVSVGPNLAQVVSLGLADYNPHANRNWIAIFNGDVVPYEGSALQNGCAFVTSEASNNAQSVEDIALLINTPYVAGYFMVDCEIGRHSLAAQFPFSIQLAE